MSLFLSLSVSRLLPHSDRRPWHGTHRENIFPIRRDERERERELERGLYLTYLLCTTKSKPCLYPPQTHTSCCQWKQGELEERELDTEIERERELERERRRGDEGEEQTAIKCIYSPLLGFTSFRRCSPV
jgi:hypothetical protein